MSTSQSSTNPRQRLSLYTHSTLGHDVSAAFKASKPNSARSSQIEETPAPPPSPVGFEFPSGSSRPQTPSTWSLTRPAEQATVGA
ncbi:hypothetical protein M501DRAFT_942797 [Patellaria atrata CBS 101060]|uniref:Uncharacterized protein n=1 Tax=Patellaria atrata CBS 101060 TaxID=1346257 RepID=A0A9P4S2K6_9PEZI|nr:hypothetical protein M501DRAFT_942797 [Patellaria atrata CBS 101060]